VPRDRKLSRSRYDIEALLSQLTPIERSYQHLGVPLLLSASNIIPKLVKAVVFHPQFVVFFDSSQLLLLNSV
jgi:hypothetical protein